MIKVAVVDEHPIVCEAIKALLNKSADIEIASCSSNLNEFIRLHSNINFHILLTIYYNPEEHNVKDIKLLSVNFPKLKILVLTMYRDEQFIMKFIKAGAKGHLSRDTDRAEIEQAIYTLRNGYDFFAKTIKDIILNSFLFDKSIEKNEKKARQKDLSVREMEVFKLFAEGFSNREIADKLFISVRTVETHKNNIMKKINLKTTVDLVKFAIKNSIIELD